ncbi:MAG: hypothetical protein IJW90_02235 [Clostridia bacterium]|nr:hypothetical protein [Clostridia bacterium]
MAIPSNRNKYLNIIQIVLSFLVMAALVFLTLGNLISIPTDKNEKTEDYIEDFYSHYSNLEGDELGDAVNLGSLKLWGEAFHLIIPTIDLLIDGDPLSELSASDVCAEEGFLLLTFLIKETFVTSIYESLSYLLLLLALMLLPFLIGFYVIYALGYMLLHLFKGRAVFMRITHCLSKAVGFVFILGLAVFFCPCSAAGPNLLYLMLLLLGIIVIWITFVHIKERSRDRRQFLIYSQSFSLASLTFSAFSLWFVHRAGLVNVMYEKTSVIDGLEIFMDLWDGQLDSHLLLMFLMITVFIACLAVGFFSIYHILTRLICIYNAKEEKSHDRLFQYPIFLLVGLLSVIVLLKASKHYAIQLTPEANTQYILAIVFAALALLCEILYSSIGHFVLRIDMVTRLEILSGYAENRLVMDAETLESAISTEETTEGEPATEDAVEGELAAEEAVEGELAAEEAVEGEPVAEEAVEGEPVAEEATEDEPAAEEAVEDEPVAEEATEDEPVAEEAAKDEPAAEEAAKDEPVAEEATEDEPVAEEAAKDEPAAEEAVEDEPVAEEAVEDEPVAEEATEDEPAAEEAAEDEPAAEEAVEDEPAAEEAAEDEPVSEETSEDESTPKESAN